MAAGHVPYSHSACQWRWSRRSSAVRHVPCSHSTSHAVLTRRITPPLYRPKGAEGGAAAVLSLRSTYALPYHMSRLSPALAHASRHAGTESRVQY
eukprot:2713116-Rhodomonas_salina.2